jgi:hypothetical protein
LHAASIVAPSRQGSVLAARQHQQQQQQRHPLVCQAEASSGAQQAGDYGALTERLVGFSSLPFTFIVVPQVLQNYANIQAGNLSALAAISWVGWVAGLAGNALMCTYLASKKEATAVNVQLIGIVSNVVVLSQLWYAQVMPLQAFAGVLAASVAISVAGLLQSRGKMSDRSWLPSEALVGAVGVGAAPQVRQGPHCAHCGSFKSLLKEQQQRNKLLLSASRSDAGGSPRSFAIFALSATLSQPMLA